LTGNAISRPFLHDGTSMIDLGTLGGNFGTGLGINIVGQVVGNSANVSGVQRAFIHNGTTMLDLNTLIAPTDPLYGLITLTQATGINDSGQIVAHDGNRAYLLTPVADADVETPEPASLALFGTALLATAALRRRARAG
jgi:probable HAF family extracellular repeat protein